MNSSAADKPAGENPLLLCTALTRPLNLLPAWPKTRGICLYTEETRSYFNIPPEFVILAALRNFLPGLLTFSTTCELLTIHYWTSQQKIKANFGQSSTKMLLQPCRSAGKGDSICSTKNTLQQCTHYLP